MPNMTHTHTANANAILDLLDDGALTVPELTRLTGLNGRIVRRNIRGLRDANLVTTNASDEGDNLLWERTARKRRTNLPAKPARKARKARELTAA